jgi:Ankyrin repeats (many copies)
LINAAAARGQIDVLSGFATVSVASLWAVPPLSIDLEAASIGRRPADEYDARIMNGSPAFVLFGQNMGADADLEPACPMHHAASNDQGIFQLMRGKHSNPAFGLPPTTRRTALMHVIVNSDLVADPHTPYPRYFEGVPILLDPAFPARVRLSSIPQIQLLLAAGANPRLADSLGFTPLHNAAQTDYGVELAELLLDAGANPNVFDKDGRTPLDHAVRLGLQRLPEFLITRSGRRGTEIP